MAVLSYRNVGVALVFLTGLIAAAYGLWFIASDQPFDSSGYADEFDMQQSEIAAFNPRVASWSIHVQNQIGSLSFGWGIFIMAIAATGLRMNVPWARNVLWICATPTLLYSALHEFIEFGTMDVGTLSAIIAAAVFVLGMGLTYVRAGTDAPASDEIGLRPA